MNEALADINWDLTNCFRLAAVLIEILLVMQFAFMLSHYWWRIIPLRKENGDVLAPPIRWTFAYHIIVALIIASILVSTCQRIVFDGRATIGTWINPLLCLALWITVRAFTKYYSVDLGDAAGPDSDHYRRK